MCGIAGRFTLNGVSGHIRDFDGLLGHRGPDGERTRCFSTPSWTVDLHHTRLAINDLSDAAAQPMTSPCSGFVLTYNGEIYNYPELRRICEAKGHRFSSTMDGEVILHLWEDEGVASLRRLNGIYSIAVVQPRTGEAVLARDPLGVKPLFFSAESDGTVYFGSEIEAVRRLVPGSLHEDTSALGAFLTFLWVPSPWTPWREIRSLRPGEVLLWSPSNGPTVTDGPQALQYPTELRRASPHRLREELGGLLGQAVKRQLLSDVPIGIMASGGVDSTLLWERMGDAATRAYTIAASRGGEERLNEDVAAARLFAKTHGTPLSTIEMPDRVGAFRTGSGDLLADPAYLLTGDIAEAAARDGIKVLFSGQGADELLGGYRRHTGAWLLQAIRARDLGRVAARVLDRCGGTSVRLEYLRRFSAASQERDDFAAYARLYSYCTASDRARILGVTEREVSDDVIFAEHRRAWERMPRDWSLLKRALVLDLAVYLPGLGLTYVDRATMAHGVEGRVPWLDHDLVTWALELDPTALVAGLRRKRPAQQLAEHSLPRYVWGRPKRGFAVPQEQLATTRSERRQQRYVALAQLTLEMLREDPQTVTLPDFAVDGSPSVAGEFTNSPWPSRRYKSSPSG